MAVVVSNMMAYSFGFVNNNTIIIINASNICILFSGEI